MNNLIFGAGINDVEKPSRKLYIRWVGILRRTDSRDPNWKDYHLYKDCTLHPDWLYLSKFIDWVTSWDNWEMKCIDKDIKCPGNRMYGPDTCIMVSKEINNFFVEPHKRSPETDHLPQGVYYSTPHSKNKKTPYRAIVRFDGTSIWGGKHATVESALQASRKIKFDSLQILIEREQCPTVKQILQEIYETKDTPSLSRW
jgi:hypothetical protein